MIIYMMEHILFQIVISLIVFKKRNELITFCAWLILGAKS